MKTKLKLSSLIKTIMTVVFCCATTALAATDEIEVGVTAASVTNAVGKPPISPARNLETGLEVFFNEKIETNPSGRAQLLFRDGTSLTVGSSSEMTIDEYVFDPDTGTGELVINVSKGIFRLVGGKISKNTPVVFNTKTATVAVRGGIAMLDVNPLGAVQADLLYGQGMTVTSFISATESVVRKTTQAGRFIAVEPNQAPSQAKKRDPATLAAMTGALERAVKEPLSAADDPTPQSSESQAPALQAEEGQAETDQPEATRTEPTAQAGQAEDANSPSVEPKPAADTEIATIEPRADSKGISPEPGDSGDLLARQVGDENPVREPQPRTDESQAMATPGNMAPADSENMPSDPSTSAGLPAREGAASNNLGASGTMPEGSLLTETSGIVLPSVDLTKTDPTKMPLVDAGLTTETENLTLAPLPAAYPASQPIQNLPKADVSAMPPPDIATNLQISSLVGKLGQNVSTYIPPIGSPIGGNPSAVSREPVAMTTNLAIAVDTVAKAPGVRTDDGKSVTAPTGGYEHSTDYHFTGTTKEDKPTHFEYMATTTTKCEDEKCKSVTSYTPVATGCDPKKHYCPEPTKLVATAGATSGTFETVTKTVSCSRIRCEPVKHAEPVKPVRYVPPVEPVMEPVEPVMEPVEPVMEPVMEPVKPVMEPVKPVRYVPPVEPVMEPVWERMGSDRATVTVGVLTTSDRYGLSATVSQADAKMILVGNQIPLCDECRFLNWYRTTTRMASAHSNTVQIQHWIAGAVSTAAELAGAARKTANYSGGLVGSVASNGLITEHLGRFDAQVRFGVSHYQVQNFNAAFDGRSYLGNSASTRNDTLFNAVATSGGRVMNAQGYFFGNPASGTPPPEIGGHFQVTGGGYDAGGVFAGARH